MSTNDANRQLGDAIERTKPQTENHDAIGTPAASIQTFATPTEVDLSVEPVAEDMIALRINSVTMNGKIILDTEPAAQLLDDVDEAIEKAENGEVDQ